MEAPEHFENALVMLRGNADTVVPNLYPDAIAVEGSGAYHNVRCDPVTALLDAVADKILQ